MEKVNREERVKANPSRYNQNISTKTDQSSDRTRSDQLDEKGAKPKTERLTIDSGYDANEQFDQDEDYGSGVVD